MTPGGRSGRGMATDDLPARIHVYDVLDPIPRGGPGRVVRVRTAEAGGPLAPGDEAELRLLGPADTAGEGVLARLEESHRLARALPPGCAAAVLDHGTLELP